MENKFDMVSRSGTLLHGVPTWNSSPIPTSAQNKNSPQIGAYTSNKLSKEYFGIHSGGSVANALRFIFRKAPGFNPNRIQIQGGTGVYINDIHNDSFIYYNDRYNCFI